MTLSKNKLSTLNDEVTFFLGQMLFKFPEPLNKMVSMAEGEDWRRIRNTLSPTFSAHRIKQMVPLMNSACDTLMKKLEEMSKTGESFDPIM